MPIGANVLNSWVWPTILCRVLCLATQLPRNKQVNIQKTAKPFQKARYAWFEKSGLAAYLFICLVTASACSSKPLVMKQTDIDIPEPQRIYIVRQGLHTGFVLPASTIETPLPQVYANSDSAAYMEFGWGDMDYYQSDVVTFGMTVKALFWPTQSVVRVVSIPDRPDKHFIENDIEALCLDREQYALLIDFIAQSFFRNRDGQIIKTLESDDGTSQFYQAEGRYSVWNTCNTWTAKGLKSAGWSISPLFKSTPGSVMKNLANNYDASMKFVCESGMTPGIAKMEKF